MISAAQHKIIQLEDKIAKLEHELDMCKRYNVLHGQNLAAIATENQRLRGWIGSTLDRFPEVEIDRGNPLEAKKALKGRDRCSGCVTRCEECEDVT